MEAVSVCCLTWTVSFAAVEGGFRGQDEDGPLPPKCFFGKRCYRRNPRHFEEYSHDHLLELCLVPERQKKLGEVDEDLLAAQLEVYRTVCRNRIEKAKSAMKRPSSSKASGKLSIVEKLEAMQPLSIFMTKIKDSLETHDAVNSVYMSDLLHPSLGVLKQSLQINFMVEWDWLKMNYEVTKNEVANEVTCEDFKPLCSTDVD